MHVHGNRVNILILYNPQNAHIKPTVYHKNVLKCGFDVGLMWVKYRYSVNKVLIISIL